MGTNCCGTCAPPPLEHEIAVPESIKEKATKKPPANLEEEFRATIKEIQYPNLAVKVIID